MIHTTIRAVRFGNIILLLLSLCGSLAHAANEEKLAEADNFYRAGDWEKARGAYAEVLTSSDSNSNALPSAFFYNLGTATARTGANGLAYAYLIKALAGQPWDNDMLHNLELVKAKVSPTVLAVRPATWISFWPLPAHFLGISFWLIPVLLSSAFLLWSAVNGRNRNRVLACAALFVTCLIVGCTGYFQSRALVAAFVKSAQIKSGPGTSYSNIVTLDIGALVNEEDSRDGWIKIRFTGADLQESVGWIEAGALLSLRYPAP